MNSSEGGHKGREVLEFDHGVRVYPPTTPGGYWRVRWDEARRHRDTTARTRSDGIAKATEIVERLGCGMATDLGKATGADLVAHFLDPDRRPPRVDRWSDRHRDEQARYCDRFILPIIGDVPCRQLTRADFRAIIDQATTPSVAQHIRRCMTGLVAAGLEEGHLLVRQDVLRGVRWNGGDLPATPVDRAVTEAEIPTVDAVHALARSAADVTEVWWRELQLLLVAYSGLRWGEHVALTADQIDPDRRRIRVDRQIVETRSALQEALPKSRRRRTTMYPARTSAGVDLAAMVEQRTLLWLVKHAAGAEARWVLWSFARQVDGVRDDAVGPDDTLSAAVDEYRTTWARVDAVVAAASLDDQCPAVSGADVVNLRWVLTHLLEEAARHAGHADILRELIDGQTGR